ncbi:unnamed protein product [Bursaphelenchus okinawaensis]|uniref:F-box domain-containing protein n=1 Tax=Bursaphelenchus okinawaensis TaxID=465554 RepID=A0A811KKM5_9BILA|nr:unnamed protein product [Bursaphelenchus okinawaensis]CAG9105195.1 unnamed protein product [Bursaphelenchus okinawaensis]
MRLLYKRLPVDVWKVIIAKLDKLKDIVSLATVNKFFYSAVNMDFQKLCYQNTVYRTKNELWAWAFYMTLFRTFRPEGQRDSYGLYHNMHPCCPYSGKIALSVGECYVLVTHVDFGKKSYLLVDFESAVMRVQLIHKGEQMIVYTVSGYMLYDFKDKKIVKRIENSESTKPMFYSLFLLEDGAVTDLYSFKKFDVNF